jgi:MYXO-CTERM domain-containing protein
MSKSRFATKQSKTLVLAAAALALHGCGSQEQDRGGVVGELLVGTTDPEQGEMQSIYYLRVPEGAGTDPELVFTKNPYLTPGTRLRVWGDRVGSKMRVKQHEVIADDDAEFGMLQQELIGAPKKPLNAAVAIVDFGGGSPNMTVDQASTRMFSTTAPADGKTSSLSLKWFYIENSYGIMDVSGKGFGPIPFTMNGCDYKGLGTSVNAAIGAAAGGEKFDKYVYYFGTKASACAWSGLGGGNQAWLNASMGCVVLMQEFGHAVNLPHSSTMSCTLPDGSKGSWSDDPSTCTHNEYGGKHSPMGSACYSMTGWERWREGWLSGCNGVKVKSTGTYTIYPIELPCNGPQVLQVPMAKTRKAPDGLNVTLSHYYLELRAPYGVDAQFKPQIVIYASAEEPVGRGLGDLRAWVLDQNPGDNTFNGWGIGAGQTFNDPAGGVSITVNSVDQNKAEIQVSITNTTVPNATGETICMDKSVFMPSTVGTECSPMTTRPDGSTVGGATGTGGSASGGSGGRGGAGGSGGAAGGMAGNAGRGGFGGQGGAGGNSGNAGNAGNAGKGGAAGGTGGAGGGTAGTASGGSSTGGVTNQGGSSGMIGTAGSSGATNLGGSPATGGAPPTSTGGTSTGGAATGGQVGVPPPVDGGCTCRVGPTAPRGNPWGLAALGLALGSLIRRHKRRAEGREREPDSRD